MEPPLNRHKSNEASNLVTEFFVRNKPLRGQRFAALKRSTKRWELDFSQIWNSNRVNPQYCLRPLSKGNNRQTPCAGASQAAPTLRDISACDSGCADEFPPGWVRDSFNSMRLFVSAPQ